MEDRNKQIVMVVDDSLLICKQVAMALKDEPFFLCEAHSGSEAEEMIEQYQPDLILLDVVLPDTDGYQLFQKLKARDQNDAVILFLTSKSDDEDVVKGFTMGACDYIKKPFVPAELKSRVFAHLQMKKQKDMLNQQNKELLTNMEKLNYMAFRDGLTGLYNRRYVISELVEDMREMNRDEVKNVLILADIDDFKQVNDTYGHDVGDTTLVCIANILEGVCRNHRVIRWGGEEFLIILLSVTENEAFQISEQIRTEVEQFKFFNEEGEFHCSITLGLHAYEAAEGIENSIHFADKALYEGKRRGKNCSVWYEKI